MSISRLERETIVDFNDEEAEHGRMLSQDIIDSDEFLDMPALTRMLYVALVMHADDDGFVGAPKAIMRLNGAAADDMRILVSKQFIIEFDSGVVCVRHWHIMNSIQPSRYHQTLYQDEYSRLTLNSNNLYTPTEHVDQLPANCRQDVDQLPTEDKLSKDKLSKDKRICCAEPKIDSAPPEARQ